MVIVDTTEGTFNRKVVRDANAKGANLKEFPVNLGKVQVESAVLRSTKEDKSIDPTAVDLGAIVSGNQQLVDLKNKDDRDESNPLLLIYPLHPGVPAFEKLNYNFNENLVPIGIAFDFPRVYKENLKGEIVEARQKYLKNKTVRYDKGE
ncbi:hypothetical protein F3K44_32705 [Bacillus megaterium]|nr:hypothetical protein [Priestia megaterium]